MMVGTDAACDIFQFERIDGMSLLLQPMRTSRNPEGGGHVFHVLTAVQILCICTVCFSMKPPY